MDAVNCLTMKKQKTSDRADAMQTVNPFSKGSEIKDSPRGLNFTENELVQLLQAFQQRDTAEKIISKARAKVPGKNKTHALRKLLNLCPECGGRCPKGRYYCDPCRIAMNARHRTSTSLPKVRKGVETDFTGLPMNPFDSQSWC